MNVPDLDILLRSVKAKELSGLNMEGGGAEFKLPDSFDIPGLNGVVNAKVFSMLVLLTFHCFLAYFLTFLNVYIDELEMV